MIVISIVIYVINGLLSAFSFNQVKTEQQKILIIHGTIFLIIAISSVYIFNNEYTGEALLSSVFFGLPVVLKPGMTPDFLYRKIKLFTILLIIMIIVFVFTIVVY